MDHLTLFGLIAVTATLVFYALEHRSPWFVLAFAVACARGSIYGFFTRRVAVRRRRSYMGWCSSAGVVQEVPDLIEQSTITCPKCGHQATEQMPTDACLFFYNCKGCGEGLKPLPGDCCVFCSYGTVPCPPIQRGQACCSN